MKMPQHQGGGAEFHARQIRRAIRDAEADGFVVDFDWIMYLTDLHIKVTHKEANRKKEAVRVWPIESGTSSTTTTTA